MQLLLVDHYDSFSINTEIKFTYILIYPFFWLIARYKRLLFPLYFLEDHFFRLLILSSIFVILTWFITKLVNIL